MRSAVYGMVLTRDDRFLFLVEGRGEALCGQQYYVCFRQARDGNLGRRSV